MMTDNEIKKALDWCEQFEDNVITSGMKATKYTFALQSMQTIKQVLKDYSRQKSEIERLEEILGGTSKVLTETCAVVKAEAIKEFIERFENELGQMFLVRHNCVVDVIDRLKKEMVGEG